MRSLLSVVMLVLLVAMSSCASQEQSTEEVLTNTHGDEVRALITSYYIESGTLDAQKNPDSFSQIATGPLLRKITALMPTQEVASTYYVTRSAAIREVHVLEYTSTRIKAVGCGQIEQELVNFDGTNASFLPLLTIMNIFVFIREDETWKLFTMYSFADSKSALRDWEYVSSEEKEAIGDIQTYINIFSGCGIGS